MRYNDILDEQIKQAKAVISHERYNLNLLLKEKANQKQGIEKWLGHAFESSSQTTPEFMVFYNEIVKYIKQAIGKDYKLIIGRGHFYFSGFLQNKKTEKWCYFSGADVRYSRDGWYNNLLMRTATDNKDYAGGRNDQSTLPNIKSKADDLTV
jgi:hypothetical protein